MHEAADRMMLDEEARRTILDATMVLLDEMEPEAITIAMVVKASRLPVSVVRGYYGSGIDILRDLAQELMDRVDDPLVAVVESGQRVEEIVAQAIELMVVTNSHAERRLLRIMRFSRELMPIEQKSIGRVIASIAGALHQRNPRLSPATCEAGAQVLIRYVLSTISSILAEEDADLRVSLVKETQRAAVLYAKDLIKR